MQTIENEVNEFRWGLALVGCIGKTIFLIPTILVILKLPDTEVAYNAALIVSVVSLIYSLIVSLHLLKGMMETKIPLTAALMATILVLLSAPGLIFNDFIFTTILAYLILIAVDCSLMALIILRSKRNGKNKT